MSHAEDDVLNPYRTLAEVFREAGLTDEMVSPHARVGRIVATWELLRIPYNVVLCVVAAMAGLAAWSAWGTHPSLGELATGAIGANVCFCAGPVANAYASWIGLRSPLVTWLLFGAGTLLAMAITAMVVAYPPF